MLRTSENGGSDRPLSLSERLDESLLRLDRLRERPAVVAAAITVAVAVVLAGWWFGRPPSTRPVEDVIPQVSLATTEPTGRPSRPLVVHVTGAVRRPGVYTLPADARVLDSVDAAGGALPEADVHQLNLAAVLSDGMQIRIPIEGEVIDTPIQVPGSEGATGPLDINQADHAQLETLPGIGPTTASAIVEHRRVNGRFASVEALLDVPGIGPAKLAALGDRVVVR